MFIYRIKTNYCIGKLGLDPASVNKQWAHPLMRIAKNCQTTPEECASYIVAEVASKFNSIDQVSKAQILEWQMDGRINPGKPDVQTTYEKLEIDIGVLKHVEN